MPRRPVVLIHGYSDKGESFETWRRALRARDDDLREVAICNYESLTNEVTIKDVAEGFDRALRTQAHLAEGQEFDAIVHSTGMLVLRSWLVTYAGANADSASNTGANAARDAGPSTSQRRRSRLKHLVALAPATFGSPLAHRGRSFLGAIFKGNKTTGPDFLEAGDLILDGLELGSRFTWDLTHADLLCQKPFYGKGSDTPYVFIFCGTEAYDGLRRLVNQPGTDGTVRWAGCSLNTQKITLDFTREAGVSQAPAEERVKCHDIEARDALQMPFWPVAGKNHTTLLQEPDDTLVELVHAALLVETEGEFAAWQERAREATKPGWDRIEDQQWQQFVVRAVDDRNDPITDYHVELSTREDGEVRQLFEADLDAHTYSGDKSFQCFHVNLTELRQRVALDRIDKLWVRVIASSGSSLVGYHGINSEKLTADLKQMRDDGVWDAEIELPSLLPDSGVSVFFPFTTTFVEIRLNRDPMPFGHVANRVCKFLE